MKICTRQDLVAAAIGIAEGRLTPKGLEFSRYISDTIKIVSDDWDDAKNIDYKTAELILSVQKDIIGIYNFIFDEHITIKDIDKYEYLIVKFSIEDGCLKIISKIAKNLIQSALDDLKEIAGIFDGMTAKQKIIWGCPS